MSDKGEKVSLLSAAMAATCGRILLGDDFEVPKYPLLSLPKLPPPRTAFLAGVQPLSRVLDAPPDPVPEYTISGRYWSPITITIKKEQEDMSERFNWTITDRRRQLDAHVEPGREYEDGLVGQPSVRLQPHHNGAEINMTAEEWAEFCDRVDELLGETA